MKKSLLISGFISVCIGVLIAVLPLGAKYIDQPSSIPRYDRFDVTATLDEAGSLHMEEEIVIKADYDSHTFFREIVYKKGRDAGYSDTADFDESSFKLSVYDKSGRTLYEDISSSFGSGSSSYNREDLIGFSWDNVRDELGERVICTENSSSTCAKVLIYLQDGLKGETKFKMSYTIKGAVTQYSDISELNWKLAAYQDMEMRNINVTLNLPANNHPVEGDNDAIYFFGHGSADNKLDSLTNTQIKMSAARFDKDEEIEVRVLIPNDVFPNVESKNKTNTPGLENLLAKEKALLDTENKYVSERNLWKIVLPILSLLYLALLIFFFIHVYKKYDKEHTAQFQGEYYRELPATYSPAEMGYLYNFKTVSKDDLNATLMDLIRLKFINIDYSGVTLTDKKPNYRMTIDRTKDTSSLAPHESFVLTWFFEHISSDNTNLCCDDIDAYLKTEKNAIQYQNDNKEFIRLVTAAGERHKFFDPVEGRVKKYIPLVLVGFILCFFIISSTISYDLPFLSVFTGLIIALSVFFIIYNGQIKRRSVSGNEDYVKWKAFKHFLEEFSHFEDYPVPGIIVWEHYLVYATAFGIADLVEKQLRTRFKELNRDAELSDSFMCHYSINSYFRYRLYTSYQIGTRTIQSAQAQRMKQAAHSGGRGGFGGGSSFGGGGGHSGVR